MNSPKSYRFGLALETSGLVLFASGVLLLFSRYYYGSATNALLALRGETLHVAKPDIQVVGSPGDPPHGVVFLLQNLTSKPIRILGVQAMCECNIPVDQFPMIIPPRSDAPLHVQYKFSDDTPPRSVLNVFTDDSTRKVISLGILRRHSSAARLK